LGITVLVAVFVVTYWISFLPFFVSALFRVPIIPFLLLFASYGLWRVFELLRQRRFAVALLAATICAGVLLLARLPLVPYHPSKAKWHSDRAWALQVDGKHAESETEYRRAIEMDPLDPSAYNGLAVTLVYQGQVDEASQHLAKALSLDPVYVRARENRVWVDEILERTAAYVHVVEAEYQRDPENRGAVANLAWALATAPDGRLRDGRRALQLAQTLLQAAGEDHAAALVTLAAANAELGRYDQAADAARRALATGDPRVTEILPQQLALYSQRRPFRDLRLIEP
jgi:tetratricopeptide (TPR) repeat protein